MKADAPKLARRARRLIAKIRRNPQDADAVAELEAHYREVGDHASLANLLGGWAETLVDGRAAADAMVRGADAALLGLGDRARACAFLEHALGRCPAHEVALQQLTSLLTAAKDPMRLRTWLRRVAADLEGEVEHRAYLARVEYRLGKLYEEPFEQPGKAALHYRRAIELEPTMLPAITAARRLYQRTGNHAAVASLYEFQVRATVDAEDRVQLLMELAQLQRGQLGNLSEAVRALRKATQLSPSDSACLLLLADVLVERSEQQPERTRDSARAAELYFRAAPLLPKQEAVRYLQMAVALDPTHGGAASLLESATGGTPAGPASSGHAAAAKPAPRNAAAPRSAPAPVDAKVDSNRTQALDPIDIEELERTTAREQPVSVLPPRAHAGRARGTPPPPPRLRSTLPPPPPAEARAVATAPIVNASVGAGTVGHGDIGTGTDAGTMVPPAPQAGDAVTTLTETATLETLLQRSQRDSVEGWLGRTDPEPESLGTQNLSPIDDETLSEPPPPPISAGSLKIVHTMDDSGHSVPRDDSGHSVARPSVGNLRERLRRRSAPPPSPPPKRASQAPPQRASQTPPARASQAPPAIPAQSPMPRLARVAPPATPAPVQAAPPTPAVPTTSAPTPPVATPASPPRPQAAPQVAAPAVPVAENVAPIPVVAAPGRPPQIVDALPHHVGREALEANVGPLTESNFYTGFDGSLVQGGVFIATYATLPVNLPVALTITLPGDYVAQALGRVRFVRDIFDFDARTEPGIGVQFEAMTEETLALFERFAAKRQPIFFD